MILHENRLPADDSHEISCLIGYFLKSGKILNCRLLQIIGGALRANSNHYHLYNTVNDTPVFLYWIVQGLSFFLLDRHRGHRSK